MSIGALPYQLPTNTGWRFLQTTRDALVTGPATGGIAEVDLPEVPAGQMWQIRRMAVSCTASGVSFAAYYDRIAPEQIADATDAGVGDVADERQPIVLNQGETLCCVWSGCPDDAVGAINVMRDVFTQAG